jgi:hypothetical protein
VLDQVHDNRVEALAPSVLQILGRFAFRKRRDERPCGIAMNQHRRATLIDKISPVLADLEGVPRMIRALSHEREQEDDGNESGGPHNPDPPAYN